MTEATKNKLQEQVALAMEYGFSELWLRMSLTEAMEVLNEAVQRRITRLETGVLSS